MIKRFLLKLIAPELDQLKERLAALQDAFDDLDSAVAEVASRNINYEELASELNYSHLFDELDYRNLASHLSYSDLADEIDTDLIEFTTDQIKEVAEHLDIEAIGDCIVVDPELTDRVGLYLSRKSLRFN